MCSIKIDEKTESAMVAVGAAGTLAPIIHQAREYMQASKSDSTKRAYRSDWEHFAAWCDDRQVCSLPASPEALACYISAHAEAFKPATLSRRLASISVAHKAAGFDSPTGHILVRETLKGIRRSVGTAQKQKAAIRVNHLRDVIPDLPNTLQGKRDRALLLIGYAGAFRRAELVSLDVADVEFAKEGAKITLRRSKTDQEGEGQIKAIPYASHKATCPVRALQGWLSASGILDGPIFRPINRHEQIQPSRLTGKAVALIIKRLAPKFGLDPADIGGHSLRAGIITDLYKQGTPEAAIMGISGHKTRTVLGRYRREADMFAFNHIAAVGL